MTQHITQEHAIAIFSEVTKAGKGFATTQELMNAAIQHYIDQQAKELPVLPEPAEETWRNNSRFFIYTADQLQAYGQQCAAHAREMALSDAMQECLDAAECYQDNGAAHLAHDYISRLKGK